MSAGVVFAATGVSGITGGIANANLNVLRALVEVAAERRLGLSVLSLLERGGDRPDFLPEWARFTAFGRNKLRFSQALLRAGPRRPLFVFDHVTLALPLLPLALVGGARTVIFAHGSEAWKRLRRTSRWLFQSATLTLTNSEYTLAKMRERISSFAGAACPLGLSPQLPLNHEIPNGRAPFIKMEAADGKLRALGSRVLLLVARLHPGEREKGHDVLIKVLPELLESHPATQLLFVGPGDDRAMLKELACGLGVGGAVFLPGWAPASQLATFYRCCYALVMPSLQEGFGLTYLEAMNYGKACVGCAYQGAQEVIVDGETGFLVRDPHDRAELVGVLRRLLSDPELASALGQKGFQRLHKQFTAAHHQRRVKEAISAVL